ncbi:tyrosine-type recombinase/integrase [Methylobacterium isbiliense]|uniref:Tyrosine recombinase XerC n=1 Tax=Methylobacterium isbiliense TaxID=315478 RepID=A0ABQ4S8H1_9HYPH|nr:site-specific integrase [Methylobacterium isbiliense]MDN3622001.1 site-specific integrase [Methylobacterium isbiliense]GJD99485.1 Tyrosine recombinase XerC [Methylobacterium isbiliense]
MPTARLTKRTVDALKPAASRFTVYDQELPGFAVRVFPSGAKSYVVEYRAGSGGRGSRNERLTLGPHGVLATEEARRLAREKLTAARSGEDPAAKRRADREAPTLAAVAEQWLAEAVAPKLASGTAALYRIYLDKHITPALGTRKVGEVTFADVDRLHRRIGEGGHRITANRVLAALSSIYTFAIRRQILPRAFEVPTRHVERFGEEARERYLTTEELQRLGAVLREAETIGLAWSADPNKARSKHRAADENARTVYSPHVTAAVRLLLFTGCRLREILHLRWADVDFERGMLFLPTSKTGRRAVVLNAPALAIIEGLPRASAYVVAGNDPAKPRADLAKPWAAFTRAAELDGLRLHDLRHSFASVGAGGGMGLPIIGRLLGHTQASTTQRYAHLHADPVKRASDRIGATIAAALEGTPSGDVVPIRHARRTA